MGLRGVGGKIDVAIIRRREKEGFKFIQQKELKGECVSES